MTSKDYSPVHVEVPDDEYWQRQIKCQYACPVHTDARGYVRAIAEGDFEAAYLIARGPNPLASICGRVCGAPCEAACRRGAIDEAVSIRALKRFVAERFNPESDTKGAIKVVDLLKRIIRAAPERDCTGPDELHALRNMLQGIGQEKPTGPQIAIIGSGPAGLAAAHDLALFGYRPVVLEMEPVPAGMLAVGIPEYRLPRDLIEAEVELIRALGVEFVCNTQVGCCAGRHPQEPCCDDHRRRCQAVAGDSHRWRRRLWCLWRCRVPSRCGVVRSWSCVHVLAAWSAHRGHRWWQRCVRYFQDRDSPSWS
ncbi:MAG: NAD(P)-binding protein [Planctomycetes bacterium]|nr:NAD(P)-binding protein [Planctomycetota bacterium]